MVVERSYNWEVGDKDAQCLEFDLPKKKALFNASPHKRTPSLSLSLSLSDLDSTFLSSIFSLSPTTSQSLLLHPTLSLHHKFSSFPIPPQFAGSPFSTLLFLSMAAPPARARADYDFLIKLLLIGDSGNLFCFQCYLIILRFPSYDSIRSGFWFWFFYWWMFVWGLNWPDFWCLPLCEFKP